jgi:hypothetical protein
MTGVLLALAASWPLTKAEATDFQETSSFTEVISFMRDLVRKGAPIELQTIGRTPENRPIVLAIASSPRVRTAEEARKSGRLVVYIQANIHAGEVEGKESSLKLLRQIAVDHAEGRKGWLERLVLIVNPIYNADGNEKWALATQIRTEQDGPRLVGTRANAQGLDLNRDAIKAASPEMRAAIAHVYNPWDPDIVMDLHTTNGTRHGYDITWAPPTGPNTPHALLNWSRDSFMPQVRSLMRARHGMETFDYGNAAQRDGRTVWETFGHEARYVTNYAGLRGQIGVLSEATSYIPFKDRIIATDRLIEATLETAVKQRTKIAQLRSRLEVPREIGVAFRLKEGRREEVILEKLEPGEPRPKVGRPKKTERVMAPVFDRFEITRTVPTPAAYLVPETEERVLGLLRLHGVQMERLGRVWEGEVDVFTIRENVRSPQPFQGVRLTRLSGDFRRVRRSVGPGVWVVPTNQRLGALACHLLEPEGDDGAGAWGFFRHPLTGEHPVLKAPRPLGRS